MPKSKTASLDSKYRAILQSVVGTSVKTRAAEAEASPFRSSSRGSVSSSMEEYTMIKDKILGRIKGTKKEELKNAAAPHHPKGKRVDKYQKTDYDADFIAAESKYNLRPGLLKAIAAGESNYNPNAVSWTGVRGLMQITGATGKELGLTEANHMDPKAQIDAAGLYMKRLLKQFEGNEEFAVLAYNAGPGTVREYINTGKIAGTDARRREIEGYLPKILGVALPDRSAYKSKDKVAAVRENDTFDTWYPRYAQATGVSNDPTSPDHHYDYKSYFDAAKGDPDKYSPVIDPKDKRVHLSSEFKSDDHPNRYVQDKGKLVDTKTGEEVQTAKAPKKLDDGAYEDSDGSIFEVIKGALKRYGKETA